MKVLYNRRKLGKQRPSLRLIDFTYINSHMHHKMRPAVGFQLFVLLLAACIVAAEASTPRSSSKDVVDDEQSFFAEAQGSRKHGE